MTKIIMNTGKKNKNNNKYWKEENLLKQVVEKTLPIAKVLYLGYQLLFLFDNAINYSVFISDTFQVDKMNKESRG